MSLVSSLTAADPAILPVSANTPTLQPIEALFSVYERQVITRTSKFFAWLLTLQWAFAILFAAVWSPLTWAGRESSVHPHLLAAIFSGIVLVLPPLFAIRFFPFHFFTRHVVAVAQMCFSG